MAEETTTTTTEAPVTTTEAPVTTTETKPAETTTTEAKPGETTEQKPAETKTESALEPVDYAKVLGEATMPEGMALDPTLVKTGGDLLAKHKITPDAAKELATFFAQQQKAGADGTAKAFADQVGNWKTEAEKTTTPEERGAAKEAALSVFGKDEVALLEHFGVTNRAGFIKALAKVSKAIKDDQFVPGNAVVNGARDARSLYSNSNMNP